MDLLGVLKKGGRRQVVFTLKHWRIAGGAALIALLVSAAASVMTKASSERAYEGWLADGSYVSMYKRGQDTILTGRVVKVFHKELMPGMAPGLLLIVKDTDNKEHTVSVGPASYLEEENISFKKGEEVTINGSTVQVKEKTVILSGEVNRAGIGSNTLLDENGVPKWEGRGK